MSHIIQISSIISPRLLQLHTCRFAQKVNKCNPTHTKCQSKIDPEKKTQEIVPQSASRNYIGYQLNKE